MRYFHCNSVDASKMLVRSNVRYLPKRMFEFRTPEIHERNRYDNAGTCSASVNSVSPTEVARAFQLDLADSTMFHLVSTISTTVSTVQQKAQVTLRYAKFESVIPVQLEFRCEYRVRPRHELSSLARTLGSWIQIPLRE
jgi:hypothetical protein